MEFNDAVTLLELPEDFDNDQLERAFRKKSLQFHPDRVGGSNELYFDLNEAFGLLKDLPDINSINYSSFESSPLDISDLIFTQTVFRNMAAPPSQPVEPNILKEIVTYTIPICIRDYYYNKSKKITVNNKENEEITVVFNPAENSKFYTDENIMLKTRIIDDSEYAINKNKQLTRFWKISLYDFLFSKQIEVRVFDEILTINREIGSDHDGVKYISGKDFTIQLDNYGFISNTSQNERGSLIIKFVVTIDEEVLNDNKENFEEAFN